MPPLLRVPALLAGGIIVDWRCSARCRHCLYGCGPQAPRLSEDALDGVLDALRERARGARFHVGGGEPFLDRPRLGRLVEGMTRRRMALEYVETNASWVRDEAQAAEVLRPLAAVGLTSLLVSLSPFHAEFVPWGKAVDLARAAGRTLPGGAFLWMAEFLEDLRPFPRDRRLDLAALLTDRGDHWARTLGSRYGLLPAGRAGGFLRRHGQEVSTPTLLAQSTPCAERLADTSDFHVDLEGNLLPGLCSGLALPLEAVPGLVDLGPFPVLAVLARGGVAALVDMARAEVGFTPAPTYASRCHLCQDARKALLPLGFPELRPRWFYDALDEEA